MSEESIEKEIFSLVWKGFCMKRRERGAKGQLDASSERGRKGSDKE